MPPSFARQTRIDCVATEFEQRWRGNDRVTVEALLAANPDVPENELLLELLLLEIELRQADGERIDRAEYIGRFPKTLKVLATFFAQAGLQEDVMATELSSTGNTAQEEDTQISAEIRDGKLAGIDESTLSIEPVARISVRTSTRWEQFCTTRYAASRRSQDHPDWM